MIKYKALTIATLMVIAVTAFIVKLGLPEKEKVITEFSDLSIPKEENGEISNDNKILTVDSVLKDVGSIVKWEGNQYSGATILWNTEDEELKLEGKGYLFGNVTDGKILKEKHDTLKVFLRDAGFENDKYNVGNNAPGYERSILKLNGIGCELYVRDDEPKGDTSMGILCTKLPEEVIDTESTPMSEKRARSIAETSECVKDGTLKDNALYNENSKTWWIDLNIDKPGCSPACVVYEDETVEINWRCTGLVSD